MNQDKSVLYLIYNLQKLKQFLLFFSAVENSKFDFHNHLSLICERNTRALSQEEDGNNARELLYNSVGDFNTTIYQQLNQVDQIEIAREFQEMSQTRAYLVNEANSKDLN
ncbi:hypothetical protein ABPG74_006880 [Tetrahymena malaccensis]